MIYSEYVIPWTEALAAQRIVAALLRFKLNQEYSEFCDFMRESMLLSVLRSNSLVLCGPWEKAVQIC